MGYRCPVCKARLWQGPFLKTAECPRCGAEFRPSVPWVYFQFLLFLFVLLGLMVVILIFGHNLWLILFFLCLVALFFWFLPSMISFVKVHDSFPMVGPVTTEDVQLKLELGDWEDSDEKPGIRFSPLYYLCILIILSLFALLLLRLI